MPKERIYFFYGLAAVIFLIGLGRLLELQIIFGSKNRAIADGNRIKMIIQPAPRGIIYDRKGKELIRNVPIYRVKELKSERVKGEESYRVISREEALRMEVNNQIENLRVDVGRDYLYGKTLSHVLGYLGEVNNEEVKSGKWKLGDLVGRTGIEEKYDYILRGKDGGELIEVDARGNRVREMGKINSQPGKDLNLAIDGELSRIAYEALEGRPGAVIATEAKTGRVLILVSSPSFDPNIFERQKENAFGAQSEIEKILNDPSRPMFNRAIGGTYPAGSTFKIVTATSGLEEKKIDERTSYEDLGAINIGGRVFRNWYFTQYGRTEGKINVVRAIRRSTDTFFYKVGEWVGPTKLAEWAKKFGLGKKTAIDIAGEVEGLVPDPEWKKKTTGEGWYLGNTYNFAIGQGDLLVTPLQLNMMTSVIVNEGKLCQPTLNLDLPVNCQDLHIEKKNIKLVSQGMKEACLPGGTAWPLYNFKPQVACKTGTAEYGDPAGKTHAWLTAFVLPDEALAKSGKESIVITVLVEAGGEGSSVAAPIVKKVLEEYFQDRR